MDVGPILFIYCSGNTTVVYEQKDLKCYTFFFKVWQLITPEDSQFWRDSNLKVEVLSKDSLHLLLIWSWHFSLISLTLLEKSLAYSEAPFAFLCDLLLRRVRQCLCYRTRGMIRCWILGALVLDFLVSLFKSFLTTDRWTSSSLERMKSFQILSDSFQSSLGPQLLRHSSICQPKNILLFSYSKLRTISNIHTTSAETHTSFLRFALV